MPTMPGYAFADTPHASTVQPTGAVYGCHSSRIGEGPRGRLSQYIAHPWAKGSLEVVQTQWLPMACGHTTRAADSLCAGCSNQHLHDNT